ncbi:MAG: basic amino acid ABC transporter substrate-binding protein [Sphaerochaetaceae bacterium]
MMKKITLVILALLLSVSLFAAGQEESSSQTYVFASDTTWPPLEYVDENGQIVGYEIDLVKEIEKLSGVTITIKSVAWDGIFAGLSNGAYDAVVSGVSVTDERKASMDFTSPTLYITQSIITQVADEDMTSAAALNGKRIGVQIGTTGQFFLEDYAEENGLTYTIRQYDEIGFAVEDLLNGNLDAVVCDSVIASDFALANANYAGKLHVSGTASEEGEPIAIAVQKGNAELLALVNDNLKKLEDNGTVDQLKKKYNIL